MKQFKITAALLLCTLNIYAADSSTTGYLDWVEMDIKANVRLSLAGLGLAMPTGRKIAEERLYSAYYASIPPFIYSIPVDSSSVLGDFVERGELAPETVDKLTFDAKIVPPFISPDIQEISASYQINLSEVSSALIKHKNGADFPYIVNPKPAAVWTGIVIIAIEPLPVHGRKNSALLSPCLFPKIWDTEMRLVFDKKHTDPSIFLNSTMVNYMGSEHIFQRNASGLSSDIQKIVGNKPLRIIARGVFGINPTDPVIDAEDAREILATEANRRLLREGRVVIITQEAVLKTELRSSH
ncbi:MAG: polymerase [Spirochaetaceae bacterium]|jgi:hypothetical protein|nr:polymerase [Spirochaetaceae bacterium]GMO19460.1 MAG: hypothetical protein Pg6A_06160 [Termitinemataceae bacterium]